MINLLPKTLDEHRDYLYKIVRLKLFFLHCRLAEHPQETVVEGLRNRVDIYRKTDANPGLLNPSDIDWQTPAWQTIETGIAELYTRHRADAAAFEEQAFAFIRPHLDARLEKDFADRSGLDGYQCGCLRYELYNGPRETVLFHIANPLQPESIFANPLYLPCCFLILLEEVERRYGATGVTTTSWLNSVPKWLAYFPAEWQQNLETPVTDVQWHYGFWGQFITARGTFNEALGEYVRRHKQLKYYPRASRCRIAVLRKYLQEKYFAGR